MIPRKFQKKKKKSANIYVLDFNDLLFIENEYKNQYRFFDII